MFAGPAFHVILPYFLKNADVVDYKRVAYGVEGRRDGFTLRASVSARVDIYGLGAAARGRTAGHL